MSYQYGLKPVLAQPRLMLRDYFTSDLPAVASLKFPLGHPDLIQPEMFLNNELGDCAIAGSIEEIRLLNASRGVEVNFTDAQAEQAYHEITGYVPGDPSSDQGTDVHELFAFRQATGIADADGNRHKILDYVGLTPGDWDEMLIALSLFEVVGIGIKVPDNVEQQFEEGVPWHLVKGRHKLVGGHYIPVVHAAGRHAADVFTWGRKQGITSPFYHALNMVAVVALTEEMFKDGKTIDGIDRDKLAADLPQLNTGSVMEKAPRRPRRTVEIGDGKAEECGIDVLRGNASDGQEG